MRIIFVAALEKLQLYQIAISEADSFSLALRFGALAVESTFTCENVETSWHPIPSPLFSDSARKHAESCSYIETV